jgi:hypothetical protein
VSSSERKAAGEATLLKGREVEMNEDGEEKWEIVKLEIT